MKRLLAGIVLVLLLCPPAFSGTPKPGTKDKCPVCGMFVAKYPDWLARIAFRDGTQAWFDGPKDMMRYYHNLKKYAPSRDISDIDSIQVTEYYHLKLIDAREAFFVLGSDVYGPMGRELVPFEREEDAKGFMRDHKGKEIYKFNEITPDVLEGL